MSQNFVSKDHLDDWDESEGSWWKLGVSSWMLIGGLLLFNIGCFLQPMLLDLVFAGLFNLLDFRTWPWWYFLCLVAILAFSVRWFFLYQTMINDDFDPQSLDEATSFCQLTGSLTALFAVLMLAHRTGWLRPVFNTLNYMFGYGGFSFWALLIFAVIVALIGLFAFLIWRWINTIQID